MSFLPPAGRAPRLLRGLTGSQPPAESSPPLSPAAPQPSCPPALLPAGKAGPRCSASPRRLLSPGAPMALSRAERCLVQVLRCFSRAFLALLSLALGVSALLSWGARGARGSRPARRTVPPPARPHLLLSAGELARRIRRRELKCVDLLEAYVERIKQVNPLINAIVKDRFEAALQEAQVVDQLLSEGQEDEESLQKKFPLLGIPVTVKEAFALYGMPNSSGLVNRRNLISTTDAVVVSRLKQAGAIPLGVTNCSELCMWFESSNRIYGRSNNPYNLDCIVGGSSGGEGSILAAAGSVMGIGSDIGGSIRMPAFFNGIFGHKPSTGVVPNDGQFPDAVGNRTNFLCTGPMCRYAEDLELMLRVMAGPNISKLKLDDPVSLQKVKFYSMEHDGGSIFLLPVDKEILQAHRKVVAHLETDLGIEVESVTIHKMKYSFQIWSVMMSSKSSNNQENQTFTDLLGDHGKPVWPSWELVKWMMRLSSHTFPAIALGITEKFTKYNSKANAKLASMAHSLQAEMVELLGEHGVLLYPSHPVLAPKHHAPLGMPFNFAYTAGCCVNAYPVYPDIDGMQDFNLVDNTMSFIPDDVPSIGLRQPRNMNSAHSVLEEEANQIQKGGWWNGGKEPSQDEAPSNLIEDVKAILWKLEAADKLRTQAFVKADQTPQKPNKRACFWKYCVTN